jgi:hypothetical protein
MWLKSALQQGVVLFPGALQDVPVPEKEVLAPVQLADEATAHVEPRQQAPVVGETVQSAGRHGELLPR